ncbi:MAG: sugar-transfer associated ATP-grasp domain-containing protein [Eubacterium sp.]
MFDINQYDNNLVDAISIYRNINDLSKCDDLIKDILFCMDEYELGYYNEYFKYSFENMSDRYRRSFIGFTEYDRLLRGLNDNAENIFKDKVKSYQRFEKYYKRDCISVSNFNDFTAFLDFANKHNTFIVKELKGSLGANISKFTVNNSEQIKAAFFRIIQYGGCICEEWLTQCDEFSSFNDTSINTIRFVTYYDKTKLKNIYGMFRTGRLGSCVDNASQGGIAAAVDLNTGVVISDGYTKRLEHFSEHPDSKRKYKGFKIPRWDELVSLITELCQNAKEYKVVGWDMTLSDNGWIMIEGNSRPNIDTIQLIYASTFGRGIRKEIESAIGGSKIEK